MNIKTIWSAFFLRLMSVSIQIKILGIVAFCILLSALATVGYTYRDDSTRLTRQLQERGIVIGTSLAAQSRDLILTNSQFALYTLIKDSLSADQDILYIFILDRSANVLVHTFDEGFPTDLLGKNELPEGKPYNLQLLQTEEEIIHDIAIPVLGGKAGEIHLGMSEATVKAEISEHIQNILIWSSMILVIGLAVAYGLAYILTGPISQLAQAARSVGHGDFRWKSPVWAKDEIGSLGIAFNEMSEDLKRKEEMRAQLLAKVISAQEEERKRIALELHDEIGQALTSLMVGLRFIGDTDDPAQIEGKISELHDLGIRTLDAVRHMATELRPSVLDDLGLVDALEKYTKEYSANMAIRVDTHFSGLGSRRLPSEIEVSLYRIVQEALTNIARHAEAKNVSVVLRHQDSKITAIIEDDGKGFDVGRVMASTNKLKLGLFGMYERASLIGGRLTVESQPGFGTTIFLEIPISLQEGVTK